MIGEKPFAYVVDTSKQLESAAYFFTGLIT